MDESTLGVAGLSSFRVGLGCSSRSIRLTSSVSRFCSFIFGLDFIAKVCLSLVNNLADCSAGQIQTIISWEVFSQTLWLVPGAHPTR